MLSQLSLSRAACEKAAARDLKMLMKGTPKVCQEHLKTFYCELLEDGPNSSHLGIPRFQPKQTSGAIAYRTETYNHSFYSCRTDCAISIAVWCSMYYLVFCCLQAFYAVRGALRTPSASTSVRNCKIKRQAWTISSVSHNPQLKQREDLSHPNATRQSWSQGSQGRESLKFSTQDA